VAKITRIKAQKSKRRVNIYLNERFAFGLDADNFLKAGLKIGQQLSETQVEDLIFKNEFQKLLDKSLRLISARPRSEKEIIDYLKRKKAPPNLAEKIIQKLKQLEQINDHAFAVWWVEQRMTFRPKGKIALLMELRQKGVEQEVSNKVIAEKVNELPLARRAVEKKLKIYKNLPPLEFRQKITGFLARRGFSWETVKEVIDEASKKQ
jgi:regulatory protein